MSMNHSYASPWQPIYQISSFSHHLWQWMVCFMSFEVLFSKCACRTSRLVIHGERQARIYIKAHTAVGIRSAFDSMQTNQRLVCGSFYLRCHLSEASLSEVSLGRGVTCLRRHLTEVSLAWGVTCPRRHLAEVSLGRGDTLSRVHSVTLSFCIFVSCVPSLNISDPPMKNSATPYS